MTADPFAFENSLVSREMFSALERLQRVPSYDYDRAYREAFGGLNGFKPLAEIRRDGSAIVAAFFEGAALALQVWTQRQELDEEPTL